MIPDPRVGEARSVLRAPDALAHLHGLDPITEQPYSRDPRYIAQEGRGLPHVRPASPTRRSSAPRPSSSSSTTSASITRSRTRASTTSTAPRARGTRAARSTRTSATRRATRRATSPSRRPTRSPNLRTEMMLALEASGIEVEVGHHEVASGRSVRDRHEVQSPAPACADQLMWFKYIVKNVARKHGKTRDVHAEAALRRQRLGMHCHQSLWKEGKPLFAGDGYAGLSQHRRSTTSAASSSTPSRSPRSRTRRRTATAVSSRASRRRSTSRTRAATARRRSASRSPGPSPEDAPHRGPLPRPELQPVPRVRAMMMAGLDGIQNKIDPGDPLDKDIYALSPEELKDVPHMPGSPRGGARRARAGSRVPPPRRRLHEGRRSTSGSTTSATQGAQPDPPAPDAARVLPLLRHLRRTTSDRDRATRR